MTRKAVASLENTFAYDQKAILKIVEEVGMENVHRIETARKIFEVLKSTYDEKKDRELIRAKIKAARARGEMVVVGIGSVGIAGTGPAILIAAAKVIVELERLKDRLAMFRKTDLAATLDGKLEQAIFSLEFLANLGEVKESMIRGALDELKTAITIYNYQRLEEILKTSLKDRAERGRKLDELRGDLRKLVDLLGDLEKILKDSEKRPAAVIFPTQPLTPPPGHGYHIPLMNAGLFQHGVEAGGLEKFLPEAKGRIHASSSREAVKYADHVTVTMRLLIKNLGPGEYYVDFDPLEKEIKAMAPFFAENIENAKKEGRTPPSLDVVTTQAPGVSRVILKWLSEALKEAVGKDCRKGRDFFYAYTPANVRPGPKWYRSIVKKAQPIGGDLEAALNAADFFYTYIDKGVYIFNSAEGAEMYKCDRNAIDDTQIARATVTARIDHLVGGNFEELKELVHSVAGVGVLGKTPTHLLRRPQIGVGGWCLTKDGHFIGYILTDESILGGPKDEHEAFQWAVSRNSAKMITHSRQINDLQPYYVAGLVHQALKIAGLDMAKSRILIAGATYLADLGQDTRFSPSFDLLSALTHNWARLGLQPENYELAREYLDSQPLPEKISVVDHSVQYWREVEERAAIPPIRTLVSLDKDEIKERFGRVLSKAALEILVHFKDRLGQVDSRNKLWELLGGKKIKTKSSPVTRIQVDEIAGIFNLTASSERNYFKEISREGILQDYWGAVKGQDVLIVAVGHKMIKKTLLADLARLAKAMRNRVIVDTIGISDEIIKKWLALGGTLVTVRKSNQYVADLGKLVQQEKTQASLILDILAGRDSKTSIEKILAGIKVSLYDILRANELGDTKRRDFLKNLFLGVKKLDWETWLALGGQYLILDKSEKEIARIQKLFKKPLFTG